MSSAGRCQWSSAVDAPARTSTGRIAAANIEWPEMPVKFSGAKPTPQPMKATLVAVVSSVAPAVKASHSVATRVAPERCTSHSAIASIAGNSTCASPRRVTANQNRCDSGGSVAGMRRLSPLDAGKVCLQRQCRLLRGGRAALR